MWKCLRKISEREKEPTGQKHSARLVVQPYTTRPAISGLSFSLVHRPSYWWWCWQVRSAASISKSRRNNAQYVGWLVGLGSRKKNAQRRRVRKYYNTQNSVQAVELRTFSTHTVQHYETGTGTQLWEWFDWSFSQRTAEHSHNAQWNIPSNKNRRNYATLPRNCTARRRAVNRGWFVLEIAKNKMRWKMVLCYSIAADSSSCNLFCWKI